MLKNELLHYATELRVKSEQIYAMIDRFERDGFNWNDPDEITLETLQSLTYLKHWEPSQQLKKLATGK